MSVLRKFQGANDKFFFSNSEKAHPCAEPRRFDVLRVKIGSDV